MSVASTRVRLGKHVRVKNKTLKRVLGTMIGAEFMVPDLNPAITVIGIVKDSGNSLKSLLYFSINLLVYMGILSVSTGV